MTRADDDKEQKIWTISHSTRDWQEFLDLLKDADIAQLVDVRSLPGSRKYPQFNQDQMAQALPKAHISYTHMPELGGRRRKAEHSTSSAWRNQSFQNYADYSHTQAFQDGLAELKKLARDARTCIMCAEAVWWRCHRSIIADHLKFEGWQVCHILSPTQIKPHPYTAPARRVDDALCYGKKGALLREKD